MAKRPDFQFDELGVREASPCRVSTEPDRTVMAPAFSNIQESFEGSPSKPRIHPAGIAWKTFALGYDSAFCGSADGKYLENRLRTAFEEGWKAAERAVLQALGQSR